MEKTPVLLKQITVVRIMSSQPNIDAVKRLISDYVSEKSSCAQRLKEAKEELVQAEEDLRIFLERDRGGIYYGDQQPRDIQEDLEMEVAVINQEIAFIEMDILFFIEQIYTQNAKLAAMSTCS